jgi:hypothetical protein
MANQYDRLFRLQDDVRGALRVLADEMWVKGIHGRREVESMIDTIDRLIWNGTREEDEEYPRYYHDWDNEEEE